MQTHAQTQNNFKIAISLRVRSFLSKLVTLHSEYVQECRLHNLTKQFVLVLGLVHYEEGFPYI